MDLEKLRHSAAHIMAAAVCRLFEGVQLDIGPAIEDGFYYDFDLSHRIIPEDFLRIEEEMARIVEADSPFERIEMSREEAGSFLAGQGQKYKLERLGEIPEDEPVTFYRCGDFIDLCRGPHMKSSGEIGAFKILSVAGSYFRGLETNPMLQRVYGTAFYSRKELEEHLSRLDELRKRDHRKLGQELDFFSMHDDVGPGLVHWHPKGAMVRYIIEDFWRREHIRNGYELLYTPHIGRAQLWETSGHLDFYKESMYSAIEIDSSPYFIKPMNCPFHIQVYRHRKRSYRDLPLRWAELGTVYRYEKAGVLHGLLRVRGFTQDDAHIICTPDQIQEEVKRAVRFALGMLNAFGFSGISAYLSTRPKRAIGDDVQWEQAVNALEKALESEGLAYETDAGGGAFYGPKIDLRIKDAIGREWQMSTIQFDFNLPDRFDMMYRGPDGAEHRPWMVHRALLGSMERFFGILVEHYAGAFPAWLAPEQARVLPLTDSQNEYAENVIVELQKMDFRIALDSKTGKIGAKIRAAQLDKVPYMLIVGPKETESGTISVRSRSRGDIGVKAVPEFAKMLEEEVRNKQP